MELFQKNFNADHWNLEITSGDMPMLSDLQLVYMDVTWTMVPRNSTQLLKINTTKFQMEREPVYPPPKKFLNPLKISQPHSKNMNPKKC